MLKLLRRTLIGVGLTLLILIGIAGLYLFWYTHRPLPPALDHAPLFQGVTYTRVIRDDPRPLVIHGLQVDLAAPGIGFLVTPRDGEKGGYDYSARTTSQFLEQFKVQVAINGDFFDPWRDFGPWDYYPHEGDVTNVSGMAVSQGKLVTDGYSAVDAAVYISRDNRVSFAPPEGELYNVIAGNVIYLRDGTYDDSIRPDPYIAEPHPRTAVALSQDERTLIIVVVDGRQPNYSEGVTLPELAAITIEFGGYTALNLDGGGSSTLVVKGQDGRPLQLGSAIHTRIPGRERPIANHLGIFALPLPDG
jgi:hypothetical protein